MKACTTDHIITINDTEVSVQVDWTFYPGCRGSRDSLGGIRGAGPPLEPDDPPEVNIERVVRSERLRASGFCTGSIRCKTQSYDKTNTKKIVGLPPQRRNHIVS